VAFDGVYLGVHLDMVDVPLGSAFRSERLMFAFARLFLAFCLSVDLPFQGLFVREPFYAQKGLRILEGRLLNF
jgi:hypothetical protein